VNRAFCERRSTPTTIPGAGRTAAGIERRQQAGAGHANLRIRLHDTGHRGGDVVIGHERLFHQIGQLG
jgi:hypothetical protein